MILLEDEGHVGWGEVWGRAWGKRHAPFPVPMTNERERQTSYGALTLLTQECHLYEAPTGAGANTVADIRWCQTL